MSSSKEPKAKKEPLRINLFFFAVEIDEDPNRGELKYRHKLIFGLDHVVFWGFSDSIEDIFSKTLKQLKSIEQRTQWSIEKLEAELSKLRSEK